MRRVLVGMVALGAVALVLGSGSSAEAGLFNRLFGGNDGGCRKAKSSCGKPVKHSCCKPAPRKCCKPVVKHNCCAPKPTCCGSHSHGHAPKVEDAPAPPPSKAPAPPAPKKGKKA